MYQKRFCAVIVYAYLLLSVSGCVPAPKEVINEQQFYEKLNMQEVDTSDLQYASLSEITKECETLREQQVGQFILPSHISLPSEDFYCLDMSQYVNFYENKEYVRDLFLQDWAQIPTSRKAEMDETEERGYGYVDYEIWEREDDKTNEQDSNVTLVAAEGGYLFYGNKWLQMVNLDEYEDGKIELALHLKYDEIPDKSYRLASGEESIRDAITCAERTVNEKMRQLIGNIYTYKVDLFYVLSNQAGKYYYSMVLEAIYKGVPFDTAYDYVSMSEQTAEMQKYLYGGVNTVVDMYDVDTIGFFRSDCTTVPRKEESEQSYLTLTSALQIAAEQLTDENIFSLDEICFCYTLRQEDAVNLETGERKYIWDMGLANQRDETCEARPTWIFSIYEDIDNVDGSDVANMAAQEPLLDLVVLIDALDGTFQYYTGGFSNADE